MIRIGIIGCGKIAQVRHLPEYAANPHVELAGLLRFEHPTGPGDGRPIRRQGLRILF